MRLGKIGFAVLIANALGIGACVDGSRPPTGIAVLSQAPSSLIAEEDCLELQMVNCYRGLTPDEFQRMRNALMGSGRAGWNPVAVEVCDALQSFMESKAANGSAGVWLGSHLNWNGITDFSSGRSAVQAAYIDNQWLWFHEAAHSYFNDGFESTANYYAVMCTTGQVD